MKNIYNGVQLNQYNKNLYHWCKNNKKIEECEEWQEGTADQLEDFETE